MLRNAVQKCFMIWVFKLLNESGYFNKYEQFINITYVGTLYWAWLIIFSNHWVKCISGCVVIGI